MHCGNFFTVLLCSFFSGLADDEHINDKIKREEKRDIINDIDVGDNTIFSFSTWGPTKPYPTTFTRTVCPTAWAQYERPVPCMTEIIVGMLEETAPFPTATTSSDPTPTYCRDTVVTSRVTTMVPATRTSMRHAFGVSTWTTPSPVTTVIEITSNPCIHSRSSSLATPTYEEVLPITEAVSMTGTSLSEFPEEPITLRYPTPTEKDELPTTEAVSGTGSSLSELPEKARTPASPTLMAPTETSAVEEEDTITEAMADKEPSLPDLSEDPQTSDATQLSSPVLKHKKFKHSTLKTLPSPKPTKAAKTIDKFADFFSGIKVITTLPKTTSTTALADMGGIDPVPRIACEREYRFWWFTFTVYAKGFQLSVFDRQAVQEGFHSAVTKYCGALTGWRFDIEDHGVQGFEILLSGNHPVLTHRHCLAKALQSINPLVKDFKC